MPCTRPALRPRGRAHAKRRRGIAPGTNAEYSRQIASLERKRVEQIRIAECYKEFQIRSAENAFLAEKAEAEKEFEAKKLETYEQMLAALTEKRRQLEEEKSSLDLSAELTDGRGAVTRNRRRLREPEKPQPEKRRKTVVVPSPILVDMLKEQDILDDLAVIRRALGHRPAGPPREIGGARAFVGTSAGAVAVTDGAPAGSGAVERIAGVAPSSAAADDSQHQVAYLAKESALLYDGIRYERGYKIRIDCKDGPCNGVISAINATEVWIRKDDGAKTKLYLTQLRLGRYSIELL